MDSEQSRERIYRIVGAIATTGLFVAVWAMILFLPMAGIDGEMYGTTVHYTWIKSVPFLAVTLPVGIICINRSWAAVRQGTANPKTPRTAGFLLRVCQLIGGGS